MNFLIKSIAFIVVVVSIYAFFTLWRTIFKKLSLKKLVTGGIFGTTTGIGLFVLVGITDIVLSFLVGGCMGVFVGITIILGTWVNNLQLARVKSSVINVTDVVMTTQVDEKGLPIGRDLIFRQTDRVIYLYITHSSLTGMGYSAAKLLIKCYREGTETHHQTYNLEARKPVLMAIEAPKDGGFQKGRYTVKFFVSDQLTEVKVKTIEFDVV